MANAGTEILSPVGRLVQGSVWELQDRLEDDGKTPKRDEKGNIMQSAYFALAVPKDSPEWMPFWSKLVAVAQSAYPQYFVNGNMPGLKDFAWKVTDGDGIDKYGKPNGSKQGFAGCWVIKFSSTFLPRCYEKGKYAKHEQLQDSRAIKTGFFVRVGLIARGNNGSKTHGLYLNADLVSLEFVGDEIISGRDASEAFAGMQQTGYVPPGAAQLPMGGMTQQQPQGGMPMGGSVQPGMMPQQGMQPMGTVQPQPGMMPQQAMQPQPGMQPGMMPMAGGAQPGMMAGGAQPGMMAQPGTMVQPQQGFVQGAMQAAGVMPQPQQPQQMQYQPQPVYTPTQKAGTYTLQNFLDNGFNIQQLLQEGYFVQTA